MTSIENTECGAITKSGTRCKRAANRDSMFCWQHQNSTIIYSDEKVKQHDVFEIPLISDITMNILSSYIKYDELNELVNDITNLKIDPKRIQKIKIENNDEIESYTIVTKIDDVVRKKETYDKKNIKIMEENFDVDEKMDGSQRGWHDEYEIYEYTYKNGERQGLQLTFYDNGNKQEQFNYENDKKDGIQLEWYPDGNKMHEWNYKDGVKDGLEIKWYENGNKEFQRNYKNGKEDGYQLGWYKNKSKKYERYYENGVEEIQRSVSYKNKSDEDEDQE